MSKNRKKQSSSAGRWSVILDRSQSVLLFLLRYWRLWLILIAVIAVAWILRSIRDSKVVQAVGSPVELKVEREHRIDVTPEEIRAVKNIGEFEFLRIQTEELVELNEAGILGDKQIARIYTGTLRIGFDLSSVPDDWFVAQGDTAIINVPRLRLLDQNFIDETRTRAFYEKGTWDAVARERLYQKARKRMMKRVLTPANYAAARRNATGLLTRIFFDMGYRFVVVNYTY